MTYWAVSDLNARELAILRSFYLQPPSAGPQGIFLLTPKSLV
jgi:hypothetical protein